LLFSRVAPGRFLLDGLSFQTEPQDVEGAIVVAIQFAATRARMPPLRKRLLLESPTGATPLTGLFGGDEQHARTSLFRFVLAVVHELTPTSISDRFIQPCFAVRRNKEALTI
jgi:hypothetical protein